MGETAGSAMGETAGSAMGQTADDHNHSVFIIKSGILDVPLGYYGALYSLGSFHLILSLWKLTEYFVKEKPNLSFRMPLSELL